MNAGHAKLKVLYDITSQTIKREKAQRNVLHIVVSDLIVKIQELKNLFT